MTAATGVLLFCFHPVLGELYYDNATVYDVLCVTFVLLLWSYYVGIRREDRFFTGNRLLGGMAL